MEPLEKASLKKSPINGWVSTGTGKVEHGVTPDSPTVQLFP